MTTTSAATMLIIALVSGCQRAEGGVPVEPPGSPPTASMAVAAAPRPAPAPSCLIHMADPPAPVAKAATHCPIAPEPAPPLAHGTVKFLGGNQPTIDVELALTPADQQRGLMYRTSMAADSGMLFSWSNETLHTFWMHNTCIPLDMLFITADGTIAGILEQVPVLNDDPRGIPCPSAHVLEVNAGYCRQQGILPGQRVRIRTP